MIFNKWITLFLIISYDFEIKANTHFMLSKNGIIQPRIDTPFQLRRPYDLFAFLNQSKYMELIDNLYTEIITIKNDLMVKMKYIDTFTDDFMYQIQCIIDYFLKEHDLFSSISSDDYIKKYIKPEKYQATKNEIRNSLLPYCNEFIQLDYSMFCYEHLDSMRNRSKLQMEAEDSLRLKELGIVAHNFPAILTISLKRNPTSWKLYTLSSYYWRLKGNAHQAIECARRAVYFAPRDQKDIALLSLGTIFQRSRMQSDAAIILSAAVDHGFNTPENYFALANSYLMLSEFNRSLHFYETAKALDKSYTERVDFIKKSMICFKYTKLRLLKIGELVDDMFQILETLYERKHLLEECHEKLVLEQVPLSSRFLNVPHDINIQNLLNRGQYCTTRFDIDDLEPVLFCDFYSDIQMRIANKIVTIDMINSYMEKTKELFNTYMNTSLGIFKNLDVNKINDNDIKRVMKYDSEDEELLQKQNEALFSKSKL